MSDEGESEMEETPPHVGMTRRELKMEFAALHKKVDRIESVLAGSYENPGLVHVVKDLRRKEEQREQDRSDMKRDVRSTAITSLAGALVAGAAAVWAWMKASHP